MSELTKESISDILFCSRSTADVHFGEKIVRMNGEMEAGFFLADPYSMFWLAEEDSHVWPWLLEKEKQQNLLTDTEIQSVMSAVNANGRHRNGLLLFLTKELEDYAFELADEVRDGAMSVRKAAVLLKKSFPGYPRGFYKNEINLCLEGYNWYRQSTERR